MNIKLVFAILIVCLAAAAQPVFAQEKTGTLQIFIKSENNDRAPPEHTSIKIYKDQEKTTTQEITSLEDNPFTTSLPLGHTYKVEVYVNSMFAGVGFIELQKSQERLDIIIKNPGGVRLSVFYADGETPISNAQVWIKSYDGKLWSYSDTDINGQTIRTWLYPTLKDEDYYYAEVVLGTQLRYVYSPMKIQPNISQELKVVTKWPKVVDGLITVEVYNSTKAKVTMQDGTFVAQLYDAKKNKMAEDTVTAKGFAHFSNLKVNTYTLYIKKSDGGELKTVAAKKVTIEGIVDTIKIYLNNPELNSDHLNCNCVAFRLDDIQDYYLAPAQVEVISLFEKKNLPLTIGVIGGVTGTDQNLISTIKGALAAGNPIEIASHSWNNKVMSTLSKNDQDDLVKKTNDKITTLFGLKPITFIPPENLFNNDTISVLKNNGFTHISYAVTTAEPPPFTKSEFYHFPIVPYTSILDPQTGVWHLRSTDQILDKIDQSMLDYGYAVVMMHPYEFSMYENGFYANKVNATRVQELSSLIDKLQSKHVKILTIGSIQDYDKPSAEPTAVAPAPKTEAANCNCVAFRLDNIQDFWLNDVQSTVMDTFEKNNVPLTVSVIGKFIGSDPKTVDSIKQKLGKDAQLRLANRGWEYLDHTAFGAQQQAASIRQTNDNLVKVFGSKPTMFAPPYDAFNKDTIEAAKQEKMLYISASITTDRPPFAADSLRHVPATVSFTNLVDDDPFLSGTIQQKALTKVQANIRQYGFAVVSMQPSDFAVKTDSFQNQVDAAKLKLLESLISGIKSNGTETVMLENIPAILDDRSIQVPDWIKNNAGWWAQGKIGDSDFTKGLEYLIEQGVVKIPSTQAGAGTAKIPDWIKNNAGWWAEGKIGNSDFVKGIQYLIENGIIQV